jgi:hypothetical protein
VAQRDKTILVAREACGLEPEKLNEIEMHVARVRSCIAEGPAAAGACAGAQATAHLSNVCACVEQVGAEAARACRS